MKWEEFKNQSNIFIDDRQVETLIKCPRCGNRIYLDNSVVLTSYPPQYRYWCKCGWEGSAFTKWEPEYELRI